MDHAILLCFLMFTASLAKGNYVEDEKKLYDELLANYNRNIRPVANMSESVRVKIGVALISILGVDEVRNSLTTQVWLRFLWQDFQLKWNPEEHGSITTIRLPVEKIWKADIILHNSADVGAQQYSDALAVVYSSGDVLHIPTAILKSTCAVDLTYFPYDTQKCTMKFSSWVYTGLQITLDHYEGKDEIDLSDFIPSQEWEVTSTLAEYNTIYYPCCPSEPFTDMTYTLNLKRRGYLFGLVYVAPIAFLAILCPIVFLLPYSDHQRFSLGGCFLICLAILLSSLERIYPLGHGTLPLLAKYYISVIVLLVLSLLFSAGIVNCADRASRPYPLPRIIKKVFIDGLGKVLCVSSESYDSFLNDAGQEENSNETGKKDKKAASNDWRALATVLDRFFFICYVILTVILSLVFLARV